MFPNLKFSNWNIFTIAGAGQGIGRDICIELSKQGAHVIAFSRLFFKIEFLFCLFIYRTLSHLESLQSEIQEGNGKCSIYTCDFEKMDNIKNEMNKALDENRIDLLVNNAGISQITSDIPLLFIRTYFFRNECSCAIFRSERRWLGHSHECKFEINFYHFSSMDPIFSRLGDHQFSF